MLTYAEFTQLRDHATSLESFAPCSHKWTATRSALPAASRKMRTRGMVSEEYFSVLGVDAAIGRFFNRVGREEPRRRPLCCHQL